jgi:hypothetical protein
MLDLQLEDISAQRPMPFLASSPHRSSEGTLNRIAAQRESTAPYRPIADMSNRLSHPAHFPLPATS